MGKKAKPVAINDLKEAIAWTEENCSSDKIRNRMRSRQVAWIFLKALREGANYVALLEEQNREAKELINEMIEKLKQSEVKRHV